MRAAASLRCRVTETRAGVFVLCDLTNVLACFEKALNADRLSEMPDFVVDGTTAVLREHSGGSRGLLQRRNLQADIIPATRRALSAPKDNPKSGEGIGMDGTEFNTPPARKLATRDLLPATRHRR